MESTPCSGAMNWLAAAAPDPAACRREWQRGGFGLMLLPAGRLWDVLLVPGRLGRLTLSALGRPPGGGSSGFRGPSGGAGSLGGRSPSGGCGPVFAGCGPVFADFGDENLGFLVPVGTAARWIGTGVRSVGDGTWVVVLHPAGRSRGVRWLVPPDGSGTLTDPGLLELALHGAAARLFLSQ